MINCSRCCLHHSMRTVNLVINFCGTGMIIYSLWLLKKWREEAAALGSLSPLPKPWFIYTCLAVGIVVCLSMLSGHMVANCISFLALSIYIVSVCSILFLQGGLIVVIFFKMDWKATISKYIYEQDKEFVTFLCFHVNVCRLIMIMILFAQVNAIMLVVILWAMGPESMNHSRVFNPSELRQSFLIRPGSPVNLNGPGTIERNFEV